MVYDCFTFFNELDLLELRLHELSHVVDHFVLVEATHTHSNQPKLLYFEENKDRFREFLPKIIHIVVDDSPQNPEDRWAWESFQRDAIMRGIKDCKPDDVIMVSDVDEIVSANAVQKYKNRRGLKIFEQKLFYYFFNCQEVNSTWKNWKHAKMICFKDLKSPQWLRAYPNTPYPDADLIKTQIIRRVHDNWAYQIHRLRSLVGLDFVIENAGWHFSYLADIETIRLKIESFAHDEFDSSSFKSSEDIQSAISKGEDLFGRKDMKFRFVTIDNSFPKYLINNKKKFARWIRN